MSDFTEVALRLVGFKFGATLASKIACHPIVGLVCHSSGVSRLEIGRGIDLTSLPEVFLGLLVSF